MLVENWRGLPARLQ